MKKLFLLLVSGSIAMSASAQLRTNLMQLKSTGGFALSPIEKNFNKGVATGTAKKTTAATNRWYSYVDYLDTTQQDAGNTIALAAPYLWNDSMSQDAYSTTGGGTIYEHNTTVSMGSILDPTYWGLNDSTYYTGDMKVLSTNAYTLDSLIIFGRYGRNPAKLGVVDTMKISILYGNGAGTSDVQKLSTTNSSLLTRYGATTNLKFSNINYDPATNLPAGTTVVTKNILLDTGSLRLDTLSNGTFVVLMGFPAISIPAGNMVAVTMAFKSGDPTFVAHDTVFRNGGTYKYGMFRPFVGYKGTTTAAGWAPYDPTNYNDGVFKTLPDTANSWGGKYVPTWFWGGTGATGSTNQYPYIQYHLNCATCTAITNTAGVEDIASAGVINVYPNPASAELRVSFNLSQNSDVAVSLTNTVGQVVATQNFTKASNGNAVFNTAHLPSGIYVYSVNANGARKTGRVVVAH